jgi:hypothetical protein
LLATEDEAIKAADSDEDSMNDTKEPSVFVREEYVLAHSNNVDLVVNNNFTGQNLISDLKFFKMITKRQMPDIFEDILYQRDLVRPLAPKSPEQAGDKTILSAELLFIHAQEDLIEKSLGP